MKLPPLPEAFGNYALRDFAEVVPPEGISWLPQTPGWLWLGGGLALLLLRYLWRTLRHWYANRYRREARKRLLALSESTRPEEFAARVNHTLKLTALAAYSRERVARLSGANWVEFLNRQCEQPPFEPPLVEFLVSATYRQQQLSNLEQHQLVSAALCWVNNHRGDQHA